MSKNYDIDLNELNNKELEFYYYSLNHLDKLLSKSLSEIVADYGCGMSFIYNFFNKLNMTSLKEYIYFLGLTTGINKGNDDLLNVQNKIGKKMIHNHELNNHRNLNLLELQEQQIQQFCESIKKANIVYGFGLGHSKLALNDLFGMLSRFGVNTYLLEYSITSLRHKIFNMKDNDILIVFTLRGNHPVTNKIVSLIKQYRSDIKIIVVTSNKKSNLIKNSDVMIFIDNNIITEPEVSNSNFIISPLHTWLFFLDYLKNYYYNLNKKDIEQKQDFIKELRSWTSNDVFYKK